MLKFFYILCVYLAFISCSNRNVSEKSHENLYNPKDNEIKSSFILYHLNDSISLLYYQFLNKDFLYKKHDTSSYFHADISLFYGFSSQPDSKVYFDSSTIKITHQLKELRTMWVSGFTKLKISLGTTGNLAVDLAEEGSRKFHHSNLYVDKRTRFSTQNFLFTNKDTFPVFSGRFIKGDSILFTNNRANSTIVKVNVFHRNLNLPPPPFSEKIPTLPSDKPDSIFYIVKHSEKFFKFHVQTSGIYFLQIDTLMMDGATVHGVDFDFPSVTSHEQMIACTRYVLTNDEYSRLLQADNKQEAIEEFWLKIGGNKERTRELIRSYYSRVREANQLFSSFQDGWRTDRGMIYIVFGSPDKVYLSPDKETWIYGKENTPQEQLFRFVRRQNRFTSNDFILERSIYLKDPWFMAVMNWREGRITKE